MEKALIERIQAALSGTGPKDRLDADLDQLLFAHQDKVYAVCVRIVGSPEKARELAQDTLLTAFRRLPEFKPQAPFRYWLYSIARNLCYNAVRKHGELLVEDEVLERTPFEAQAFSKLRKGERASLLRLAAAAVLDPLEQEAVYLRYEEQLPVERITALLGITTKTGARGVLQSCRRKLNKELRRRLQELGEGSSFLRPTV